MPIRILDGDVTKPERGDPCIVAHVVNNQGYFGAGVALAIAKRWPHAKQVYARLHAGTGRYTKGQRRQEHLGCCWFALVNDPPIQYVAHLVAMDGLRTSSYQPFQLSSFQAALGVLGTKAQKVGIARICMPYGIGAGLAGGEWRSILPALTDFAQSSGLTVELYRLPQ